jgi:hypothetical protein
MVSVGVREKVQELDPMIAQEIESVVQGTERGLDLDDAEPGIWYVQMPSPGVQIYFFEKP